MQSFENLDSAHFEVLREVGNIGAGNAITALSKILGKKVNMTIPIINLLEFKDIATFVGGPENTIIGILVGISGDINGIMMFIIKLEQAKTLINILFGRESKNENIKDFDEIEISALKEVGNILSSSYLGSLSQLFNFKITPSVPYLSIDMANAILSVPAIAFSKVADKVLFIESVFDAEGKDVSGYFVLVPEMASFPVMLKALGVLGV
ncbi:MAG: chemotaxis protein CheC [Clostridiales bacterium]|jgi:chemotaxis protein CheC|nr:chemotaxis protein CheC [Clostridiales bacterium]